MDFSEDDESSSEEDDAPKPSVGFKDANKKWLTPKQDKAAAKSQKSNLLESSGDEESDDDLVENKSHKINENDRNMMKNYVLYVFVA